ncbi:MAG TPA: SURF1 family protein [Nitrosomonas sp.]|nr:SURF1 family protein [Nitrosomonas sp.]
MNILGYQFEPKAWSIVLTLIATVVFSNLGLWQLSRADEKETQHKQLEQFAKQPPVLLPATLVKLEEFEYRDVEVEGEFVNEMTIYLDNKTYQGRAGYHVITPLRIDNSSLYVAVNRGWVATGYDRSILPPVPKTEGVVHITGTAVSPNIKTFELSDKQMDKQVWNSFSHERYQQALGIKLQPLLILQKSTIEDGLIRDWHKPESGSSKNIGYAVQWFSLAATTIIIFIVLNVKRRNKEEQQT